MYDTLNKTPTPTPSPQGNLKLHLFKYTFMKRLKHMIPLPILQHFGPYTTHQLDDNS